jgi:4-amino-4-deoxy-L-arabinose transferase-like glycosyltransferase
MPMRWPDHLSYILVFIVCAYLFVGGLYALYTPAWQAPDEPAHYNYVRYLAENGRFPVLHYGDYPHAYLEQIKSAKFPPDMSVEPIRYEFWQPPLYYVLATPIYRLFDAALLPLRLLSLALGAGVLVTAYAIVLAVRPGDTALALGTVAFVAFVPMHLTMMASVNNDALAELLLAVVMLRLIQWTRESPGQRGHPSSRFSFLTVTGLLLGLGLVTKATVYVALPLALIALVLSERRPARLAWQALALFGPALVLAFPWYVRNVAVYGWPDLLGTRHHAVVVVGQLRTADYLADVGWAAYLKNFLTDSFHSFWGQFGWMAVPMDRRVYLALGLLSALAVVGWVLVLWRGRKVGRLGNWEIGTLGDRGIGTLRGGEMRGQEYTAQSSQPSNLPVYQSPNLPTSQPPNLPTPQPPKLPTPQTPNLPTYQSTHLPPFHPSTPALLAGLWLILTILMYLYYNLSLVQFQGRYLFPALVPIGLLATLGLREILSRRWLWVGVSLCGAVAVVIGVSSALGGGLDKWGLLIAGGSTIVLGMRRWLPARVDGWVLATPLAGLAILSVYSLFAFIVPYLSL